MSARVSGRDIENSPEMRRHPDDASLREMQRKLDQLFTDKENDRQGAVVLELNFTYKNYQCKLEVSGASDPAILARLDLLARALSGIGASGEVRR